MFNGSPSSPAPPLAVAPDFVGDAAPDYARARDIRRPQVG